MDEVNKQLIISKALGVFLLEVTDGQAHFTGFYEQNEDDYGPHPLRYIEVSTDECPVWWLYQLAKRDINLAYLAEDFEQWVYDSEEHGDEWTMNNYCKEIANRQLINESDLKNGPLPDGEYAIIEWWNEL